MSVLVIRGNALTLPLPDASVDLIVTSPPYFALRDYRDGDGSLAGQIGAESTPRAYIAALLECTAEWVRVLKPSGSIFVNLGDSYYSGKGAPGRTTTDPKNAGRNARRTQRSPLDYGLDYPRKSLLMLPERYRIGCVDQLGLIARAVVVWDKPNGLPESVTDRVRRSHEDWVHLAKQGRYYSAVDEIREACEERFAASHRPGNQNGTKVAGAGHNPKTMTGVRQPPNPLGKLPGSVWRIATEPLPQADGHEDHFAAFPSEWPRRLILGWSPRAVCNDCGFLLGSSYDYGMLGVRRPDHRRTHQGRARPNSCDQEEPVLQQTVQQSVHSAEPCRDEVPPCDHARICGGVAAGSPDGAEERLPHGTPPDHGGTLRQDVGPVGSGAPQERGQDGQQSREPRTTGQGRPRPAPQTGTQAFPVSPLRRTGADLRDTLPCPNCGGSDQRPSLIVDPFGGTGTTAHVASALGRVGVSVDLSAAYCRRATDPVLADRRLRKVLGITTPAPKVDPGQGDLFAMLEGGAA